LPTPKFVHMRSQIPLYDIYTKVGFMQLVFHNMYLYKKQTHKHKNTLRYLRWKWALCNQYLV